jgi:hypothetical protein
VIFYRQFMGFRLVRIYEYLEFSRHFFSRNLWTPSGFHSEL